MEFCTVSYRALCVPPFLTHSFSLPLSLSLSLFLALPRSSSPSSHRTYSSLSTVSLSFSQQERSSIILHLSSMRPGDFRDFWIEISMAADNAAVRGQLHSLMDPPHITVTYTYVSFVKSEYRQRPFYVSSYGPRLKWEIDVLYFTCLLVRVIRFHRASPFLLPSCFA